MPVGDRSAIRVLARARNALVRPRLVQRVLTELPLPAAIYRRLPPAGRHIVTLPGGASFFYDASLDDIMARGVIWDDWSTWEIATRDALIPHLMTARRMWDVGAYAGIYSMLACAVNPNVAVTAFEPIPRHAEWLRANICANGWEQRIKVVDAAVSDRRGSASLTVVDSDITASGIGVDKPGSSIKVDCVRLSDFSEVPDVIKIDVEGHEIAALSTVTEVLESHHPVILTECLNRESLAATLAFVEPLGYELHHLSPVGTTRVTHAFDVPGKHANFLALGERRTG